MQKLLVLIIAGLLGLIAFMFITSQPAVAPDQQTITAAQQESVESEEDDHDHDDESDHTHDDETPVQEMKGEEESEPMVTLPTSGAYLGAYTLMDTDFGTEVVMTIDGTARTMSSNALANHEVGEFPRAGNPNTISEQDNTYTFPIDPTFGGNAAFAREPGIAINGVKFEPQTAERVSCETGEEYSIEAIQDVLDLGLDFNNAHVQPTGAYHYHAVADNLVEVFDEGSDLVHVGFAKDGFLMYYSKSGVFKPSYGLAGGYRSGTDCTYNSPGVTIDTDLEGTKPDGTYVTDWSYTQGVGDLDECNGVEVSGQYVYLITDEYPYIPRCLMGEFTEERQGGGAGQAGEPGAGGPPGGPDGERPSGAPRQ